MVGKGRFTCILNVHLILESYFAQQAKFLTVDIYNNLSRRRFKVRRCRKTYETVYTFASEVGRCRKTCKIFNMHLIFEFYFLGKEKNVDRKKKCPHLKNF
jgi:hypothetical protein